MASADGTAPRAPTDRAAAGGAAPGALTDSRAAQGVGGGGGSSFGWYDDGDSGQILDEETIELGTAGVGGAGSQTGPSGTADATNL